MLLISCTKVSNPADDIVTGTAEVTRKSVTICGYLYAEASVRNTCQFGILYSTDKNLSEEDAFLKNSVELDSDSRFEVTLEGLSPDTEYFYKAFLKDESGSYRYGKAMSFKTFASGIPPETVDLGLSVLWSDCNLGALAPEEYGDYYAWGEIETKDIYSEENYKFETIDYDTGYFGLTKYVPQSLASDYGFKGFFDDKEALDPEDDIVRAKFGGKWRMPTIAEFGELIKGCTSEWTKLNGVRGMKFTSRKAGYTDKWIFFPAEGWIDEEGLDYDDTFGYYWSSSLGTDCPIYAYVLKFATNGSWTSSFFRPTGISVRPVTE